MHFSTIKKLHNILFLYMCMRIYTPSIIIFYIGILCVACAQKANFKYVFSSKDIRIDQSIKF